MRKQFVYGICASILLSTANLTPVYAAGSSYGADDTTVEILYNYDGADHIRQMEKLGRGLVAVNTDNGVYLSWRLLGTEANVENISHSPDFEIYKNGTRLCEVTDSTNYLDTSGTSEDVYTVGITDGEQCETVSVWNQNYTDIPLIAPPDETIAPGIENAETTASFAPSDASCGDLDGDGEYELVIKWTSKEVDVGKPDYCGTVHLDAYELDGTKMWENTIALGRNIYSSAHTLQFVVYDLDGDGKAEIVCQTSLGSKDALGTYVSKAANPQTNADIYNISDTENEETDYRNDYGDLITTGEEFLTAFSGETGVAIDTIHLPNKRVSAASFGDDYGNRCNRFVADVSYLDGERPYAVFVRGYYARTTVSGVSLKDGRLSCDYQYDTLSGQPGYTQGNELYEGNGNHNMTSADVDDDGRDEIILGGICIETDNTSTMKTKWCTFRGHGDALHIGDYDPTHKGMEFFTVHEGGGWTNQNVALDYGASVIDASTGETLFHKAGSKDTGRGLMANVGAGGYYQIAAASNVGGYYAMGNNTFEEGVSIGTNFRIFWDGDIFDETLDGTAVSAWNGSRMAQIFNANGCVKVNGTKSTPSLQADLFGDWREELVYPTSDYSALRVYTTTDLTQYKLPTLMHDPVYRSGVASEQSAYNQPPHIGFYLAEEIFKPDVMELKISQFPDKTDYLVGEEFDSAGIKIMAYYNDGSSEDVTGYIVSGYDKYAAGEQTLTVTYAQISTEFTVTVNTGFVPDENGYITDFILDDESATIPETINGVIVRGFVDGALINSNLKSITALNEHLSIGKNVFPDGISIICYPGSDIYNYAIEHKIAVNAIDTRDYLANVTYSETDYSGMSMLQNQYAQTKTIGHMLYGVGGRRNGGGDGKSGFEVIDLNGDAVLSAGVGRFHTNGRAAYLNLVDTQKLSDSTDSVFETDIMFPTNSGREVLMTVYDSSDSVIDRVSRQLFSLENDKWYTYKLVCHRGTYYRILCERGGSAEAVKIASTSSEYGVARFTFTAATGTNIGNNQSANMYFDNIKLYTDAEISELTVNVIDENGNPISKPSVKINDTDYRGNAHGIMTTSLFAGTYSITVSADGYMAENTVVGAYKSETTKTIVLKKERFPLTGIGFNEETFALKNGTAGRVSAVTIPANAEEQGVIFETSDETVALIDQNGVVTAVGEGTATLIARSAVVPEIYDSCEITVYGSYTSKLTSVKIAGADTTYIPNASGTSNSVQLTAKGYDQNGVEMSLGSVTWTTDSGLTVKNGKLVIPAGTPSGICTVTATSKGIKGSITITLEKLHSDIIAEEKLEEAFTYTQGTVVQTKTIDDITYVVGARSGSGDGYTGFEIGSELDGKLCLSAKAGRWADSGRQAYMVFDKAQSGYDTNHDYVLETDIYFRGTIKAILCDSADTSVLTIDAASLGLEQNKWYHYILVYSDEKYTQYILDSEGKIVSVTEPVVSQNGGMISRIHFHKGEESTAEIGFIGLVYYTVSNAFSTVSISVEDSKGNAVAGADVAIDILTATTDSNGKAEFILPKGVYTVTGYVADEEIGIISIFVDGQSSEFTISPEYDAKIISADNRTIVLKYPKSGLVLYAADYDENGVLVSLDRMPYSSTEFYVSDVEFDKVFLWNGMTPVDLWTKGE